MIFCPKCGNQNPDGASFCKECGSALKDPAAEATQAAAPQATAETAPVNATAPMPAAAAPQGVGAAPATEAAPAAAVPNAAPAGAPVAAKTTNKMPIIIGAAVVVIAAILLIVLLVIPRCSTGAASGANLNTLVTGSTSEAQAALDKMESAELELGIGEPLKIYVSNDKMKKYVEDLFEDVQNGDISSMDDVINASKAKELNGQWMLMSTADKSFEQYIDLANSQIEGYDLGHMAAYVTVVEDNDLTNEEVAKLVSAAGLQYEHATVCDYSMDAVMDFAVQYVKMALASSGNARNSKYVDSYVDEIQNVMDELGVTRVGSGVYLGNGAYAMSVSAQFDGYAVVMLFAFNPDDFGMGELLGEDFVKRMYVK